MNPEVTIPPAKASSGLAAVGDTIAERWEVQLRIGGSHWGEVFLVLDRHDQKQYACKFVHPHLMTAAMVARIAQTRNQLTAMSHPNLLDVYDAQSFGGSAFFVMRLANGPNLGQWLAETGPLTVRDGLDAFKQILDAVRALHDADQCGLALHPGNVLVESGLLVAVSHLGLPALLLAADRHAPVEGRGAWFFAPEWRHGRKQAPEALRAADIYSTSVMGYLLLAGKHPFPAPNAEAAWQSRQNDEPMLPSKRAPDLSPSFNAPLMKGLARRPEERFGSINELREAIFENVGAVGRYRSILIVDDDVDFARYATAVLRVTFADASVTAVSDPRAALRVLDRRPPSVLLLDLDMPDINGLEIAAALRETSNPCEIVVVTADGSPSNRQLAEALGVRTYIRKPVTPQALADCIAPLLR